MERDERSPAQRRADFARPYIDETIRSVNAANGWIEKELAFRIGLHRTLLAVLSHPEPL